MDSQVLREKYLSVLQQYALPIILGFFCLIFLGYGLIQYFGQKRDKQDILFEAASDKSSIVNSSAVQTKQASSARAISVDVEGAVQKSGVYELPGESRIQDALIAAGGLGNDADREKVAKSLNLASRFADGAKIYIPYQGEQGSVSDGNTVLAGETQLLVNINSASVGELDMLPGIGKATADKIIGNRPYGSIDELVGKKIVGEKVFEEIKEKIVAQ